MSQPPPAAIYIIRHGEKPADLPPADHGHHAPAPTAPFGVDYQGNQDEHSLLPRGWQRSGALAALFAPALGVPQAGLQVPTALLSLSYGDPATTITHRTYQTIQGWSRDPHRPSTPSARSLSSCGPETPDPSSRHRVTTFRSD